MKRLSGTCYKIGDRIECDQNYGTIKYIGLVEGKEHTWLGIDWDNPQRGKHNGNVNGIQYFTTRYSHSGSFIRPEKISPGVSVMESIITRYKKEEDEMTAKIIQQKQLKLQQTINAPFLEMVGFEKIFNKQSNLQSLRVVNLREQNINSVGDLEELRITCPNIEELDISKNLLSSWEDIFNICQQFEHLHWLNVSKNLLRLPENDHSYNIPNVKILICGNMELTWTDLLAICNVFSQIEEIWAPFNNITKLSPVNGTLQHLKTLDLEGNLIEDWNEICKLSGMIKLEQLLLEHIGLKSIKFIESGPKISSFKSLKKLCLTNNLISEWQSITELNKLENLENLKITKNPVLETESIETVHQLLIAKLEKLKILNGVEIEPGERRGAEYDYLKKYGLEWLKVKNTPSENDFVIAHPRYSDLVKMYGEMEEAELKTPITDIKSHLVELHMNYNGKIIKKKLPTSMTVQKLEMMVQKLFRLTDKPILVYNSSTYTDIQINLDDEMKDLATYSMQNGDQIIVHLS